MGCTGLTPFSLSAILNRFCKARSWRLTGARSWSALQEQSCEKKENRTSRQTIQMRVGIRFKDVGRTFTPYFRDIGERKQSAEPATWHAESRR